jgi:GntR family transcriptional repressor for pyruvate dehydrogenase complex
VAETRRRLEQITDDWTPLSDADARWHEALARATKNRLRIGISLGLHEPFLRQVPGLGEAHARYARTIPAALAEITGAVEAHAADEARSAMVEHIELWARLNPDVDLGP